MNGIKVTYTGTDYIDFIIANDDENLYRYEKHTGKMRKLIGFGRGNFGKAIRGKQREIVEKYARYAFENNLPLVLFEC